MSMTSHDKNLYTIPSETELIIRIERLEKLAAQITKHKERFNYRYIFSVEQGDTYTGDEKYAINDAERLYSAAEVVYESEADIPITAKALKLINNCGTQCCVAGFTCLQRLESERDPTAALIDLENEDFMGASKYLFLNDDEAMFLFCPSRRERFTLSDKLFTMTRHLPLIMEELSIKNAQYRLYVLSRLLYYDNLGIIDFQDNDHDYEEAILRIEYITEYTRLLRYHPIRKAIYS